MVGRLLIIGDKGQDTKALAVMLKKSPHFLCRVVSFTDCTGESVVKYRPDIILANSDGESCTAVAMIDRIKGEKAFAEVPLVLAAKAEAVLASGADVPYGIHDLLITPLRPEPCAARLLFVLRKIKKVAQDDVIRCDDLEIDVSRYEVRLGGQKIDLTYTEYELLRFLAVNPGRVFDRDVLLNKVWGYDYFGGARTVDVHVRRLRSKIEIKNRRFIETVRNIGYRFTAERT